MRALLLLAFVSSIFATEYMPNAIPPMFSNTSPSGIVTSERGGSAAFRAFDQDPNTSYEGSDNTGDPTSDWICYEFPEPRIIGRYAFTTFYYDGYAPTQWFFQASNNGTDWVTFDEHYTQNLAPNTRTQVDVANLLPYKMYRLAYILNEGGNPGYLMIPSIEMYEPVQIDNIQGTNYRLDQLNDKMRQAVFLLVCIAFTLAMLWGAYTWRLILVSKNEKDFW